MIGMHQIQATCESCSKVEWCLVFEGHTLCKMCAFVKIMSGQLK